MADAKGIRLELAPTYNGNTISFDTFDIKHATPGALRCGLVTTMLDHNPTITHVGFRQGVTSGTPAANSHKIGLYTVDGSGLPTTTDLGGGSPTAVNFTPAAANDGKFIWIALTNSVQIARGTDYSIVIQNNADTSVNGITVAYRCSGFGWGVSDNFPYPLTYAASTWTKSSSATRQYIMAIKSSTKAYGVPIETAANTSNVSTSGHRSCMKFTLPAGWGTSYKIVAARNAYRCATAGATYIFGIWNAAGTLLQGGSRDGDTIRNVGNTGNTLLAFPDTTLATLLFGTTYYVGLESVSSSIVNNHAITLSAADDNLAFPLGNDVCYSVWNGSTWTDTTTLRPQTTLILDDITPPSGGGLRIHPGMLGGMRG